MEHDSIGFKTLFEAFSRPTPQDIRSVEMRAAMSMPISEEEKRHLEADYYKHGGGWQKDAEEKNTITTIGFQTIGNRLTGASTYASTYFPYFAWSNGATTPSIADTATTFYADGSAWGTKAVTTIDAFNVLTFTQTWECFLSSTDNGVSSITKFALMNATPGTIMFNSVIFPALAKSATIERWLVYSLIMSQI